MSADKSTEWLIDLLYQEEPDADPGGPPESLSEDDLALSQAYRSFLTEVREQLPEAEPAQHTLDAILEAARAQAAAATAATARATRAPQAPRDLSSSIWRKARVQTLSQIAGVALVLVVGAFALGKLPQSDRSPESAAMTGALAAAPQADFPEVSEKGEAEAPGAPVERGEGGAVALGDVAPKEDSYFDKARDVVMRSRAQSAPSSFDSSAPEPEPAPELAEPAPPADNLEVQAEAREEGSARAELDAAPAQSITRGAYGKGDPKPTAKRMLDSLEATAGDDRASLAPAKPLVLKSEEAKRDAVTRADADGELAQKEQLAGIAPLAAAPQPSVAPRPAAPQAERSLSEGVRPSANKAAPAGPTRAASTISLQGAEGALQRQDYRTALSQADGFLGADLGKPDERARALEIKAKAHEGMGQSAQAARALEALERDHPAYYKARNLQQVKRKARKAPESSVDILPSSKP